MPRKTPKFTAQDKAVAFLDGSDGNCESLDLTDIEAIDVQDNCPTNIDEYDLAGRLEKTPEDFCHDRKKVDQYIDVLDKDESRLYDVEAEIDDYIAELQERLNIVKTKRKNVQMVQKAVQTRLDQAKKLYDEMEDICPTCGQER